MRRLGFSLLEVAVVLSIIAFLTGGVIMGRTLMRAAELRKITSTLEGFTSTIGHFKEKYEELPGDMSRATEIWGAHASCPGSALTPSVGVETCNGDGNGRISHLSSALPVFNWMETYRSWQHLAAAGMVEGQYTGVASYISTYSVEINKNIPFGGLTGMGVTLQYGVTAGDIAWFPSSYGNVLAYGAIANPGSPTSWNTDGAMTAGELYRIDEKLDDGLPGSGKIMEFKNSAHPNCVTTNDHATARYVRSDTTRACHIIYKTGY